MSQPANKKSKQERYVKALMLVNQGKTQAQALKELGYSPAAQHNPATVFKSKTMKKIQLKMSDILRKSDMGEEFLASQLKELFNAKKDDDNDYVAKNNAIKHWLEIFNKEEPQKEKDMKRQITWTEYVWGSKKDDLTPDDDSL